MADEDAVLEPQTDADASSDDDRYEKDTSIDTSVDTTAEPVAVETKAEEADEEPESEVDPSPTEVEVLDEKADSEPEVPASVQDRIDEVIKSRRKTEELLSAVELENQQLRKQVLDIPVAVEPFKTLSDFEFDEGKYQSYMASEMNLRSTAAAEIAVSNAEAKTSQDRIQAEFDDRVKVFAKTVKDYDEVTGDRNLRISPPMAEMIKANKDGPQMYYFLASQPGVARSIALLSPVMAGSELEKIRQNLITERAKAAKPKVTEAPPPVPKIKSGDAGMERGMYTGMSDKAFDALRRKQIANR